MIEKNSKISVLRKMIGLGEQTEPHFIVPQNSITNLRQKMGLTEQRYGPSNMMNVNANSPTIVHQSGGHHSSSTKHHHPMNIPLESNFNEVKTPIGNCPNCENMAKNFLYLESLIRSNYNARYNCSLCYSSLKYLQYVNKNIMQIFGNFDSIVSAAKEFSKPQRHVLRVPSEKPRKAIRTQKPKMTGASQAMPSRTNLKKKKSRATQHPRLAGGGTGAAVRMGQSRFSVHASSRQLKTTSRQSMKKVAKKKASRQVLGVKGGKKVVKVIKNMKPKNVKAKRNKVALMRVHTHA